MPKSRKWLAAIIICGILILITAASYVYMASERSNQTRISVSVIVYGSADEKWTSFKQGVDQAASDLDAIVNFITMADSDGGEEQIAQMEREIQNGTEGIVVAVADSREMADYISVSANVVPIVLAESSIYGNESLTCVSADAYGMGKELAAQVIENTASDMPIYIVQTEENRNSQKERLSGLRDGCEAAGRAVVQTLYPNQESMGAILESDEELAVIAVDDRTLETVVNIIGDSNPNINVYGIGSSEMIVFALDQGQIEGIVFQNEFNMGYEAMDTLVQKIRKGASEEPMEIDFYYATKETLHETDNERLLYPIIQ